MIKVLVLDDDVERHQKFRANFLNCELTCVTTVKECLEKLVSQKWDVLCLDHDLGDIPKNGQPESTGYDVSLYLGSNPGVMPTEVVLHSLNEPGRKRMKSLLPDAREMPFIWTIQHNFTA